MRRRITLSPAVLDSTVAFVDAITQQMYRHGCSRDDIRRYEVHSLAGSIDPGIAALKLFDIHVESDSKSAIEFDRRRPDEEIDDHK